MRSKVKGDLVYCIGMEVGVEIGEVMGISLVFKKGRSCVMKLIFLEFKIFMV